jgi:glycine/D-amino acid oxidase-like deaminating enzyme/nitrite reductase/ring-hydroxylating ferredoxin subunit
MVHDPNMSYWHATTELPLEPTLADDIAVDVCIIGAGIVGMTAAYLLTRNRTSVAVLDDGAVGSGQTGRTTAHLSNVLDDRYHYLERTHGERAAMLAADSHAAAIDRIESIIATEEIDCDFERVDGFLFAPRGVGFDELDRELAAAQRAGVSGVEPVGCAPFPAFDTGACLRFPHQAQFHPLRYLAGLARAVKRDGGRIYNRSHVEGVDAKSSSVITRHGRRVTASAIIVATNVPINDRVVIHTKQAAYHTYVIGARVPRGALPRALYWDTADPYHYVRVVETGDPDHELLLVGGEDHKTGQADDGALRYARLEAWARERVPRIDEISYRWSGQVIEPVDGVAYLGVNPGDERVFIATGDSGNGITHGTIAGMLFADAITGQDSPWMALYDPARKTIRAAAEYARENLNVAARFSKYLTLGERDGAREIPPGTGAVLRRGLAKVAIYRDDRGGLHEFSAVCRHLGCIVAWNADARTWDCPCHGSRYDAYGRVVHGPAVHDLTLPARGIG